MLDELTLNANKPAETESGYAMLERMNNHHKELHSWAFSHIKDLKSYDNFLDVGFGGGQNIKNIFEANPLATVYGVDYSEASCKKCAELNKDAIDRSKLFIKNGTAEDLSLKSNSINLATAFETIYYWSNIDLCFKNIYDALAKNGVFLICNEDSLEKGNEEIKEALNMVFYSGEDLKALLEKAGFSKVEAFTHENGKWVCAVATK